MLPILTGVINQYLAGLSGSLLLGCSMAAFCFTNSGDSGGLGLRQDVVSLAGILYMVASSLVLPPVCWCSARYGLRTVTLATGPLLTVSWAIIFYFYLYLPSPSAIPFYIARCIQGAVMGLQMTILPPYLGEVADSHNRGKIQVMSMVIYNCGNLFQTALNTFFDTNAVILINAILPMVSAGMLLMFPESPYFLLSVGRGEAADRALAILRRPEEHNHELVEIKAAVEADAKVSWRTVFTSAKQRRALLLATGCCNIFFLMGWTALYNNMGRTFWRLTGSDRPLMMLGIMEVLAHMVNMSVIERWGRRPTMLLSYAGSALLLIPVVVLLALHPGGPANYAVVALITGFGCFQGFGEPAALFIYVSELSNTATRTFTCAWTMLIGNVFGAVTLYTYPLLEDAGLNYVNYSIFLSAAVFGLIFVYFFLPETKNKTLVQVFKEI